MVSLYIKFSTLVSVVVVSGIVVVEFKIYVEVVSNALSTAALICSWISSSLGPQAIINIVTNTKDLNFIKILFHMQRVFCESFVFFVGVISEKPL